MKLGEKHIDEFFATKDYADGTRVAYRRVLERFLKDVRPGANDWHSRALDWRTKLKFGPCSKSLHVTAARQFLDYCVDEGYVDRNPMKNVKVKPPKGHHHETLNRKEVSRLLAYFRNEILHADGLSLINAFRDNAIVHFMLYTAVRASGVIRLDVEDFTRGGGVTRVAYWCKGHAEKDEIVVLPAKAEQTITDYLKETDRNWKDTGPLFLACNRRRMSYSGLYVALTERFEAAGLTRKGICVHSLRHTAALNAYMRKRDLIAVQKMLGHRSANTTQQYLQGFDRVKEAAELGIEYD